MREERGKEEETRKEGGLEGRRVEGRVGGREGGREGGKVGGREGGRIRTWRDGENRVILRAGTPFRQVEEDLSIKIIRVSVRLQSVNFIHGVRRALPPLRSPHCLKGPLDQYSLDLEGYTYKVTL